MTTDRIPQESYYAPAAPTERLSPPRVNPYAIDLLFIGARLLVCLAAIWMGMVIAVQSNDGVAVLAALACAGVIYGCLGGKKA